MSSPVHILATVRHAAMLPATLLVFKTLRIGFPTPAVYVWGNALEPYAVDAVRKECQRVGATFNNLHRVCHDEWAEQLILHQAQPFWISDTDMVYFKEVEWFFDDQDADLFAGRFEPTWLESWSDSIHCERLHTCCAWYNPAALRARMLRWNREEIPAVFHSCQVPFIRQHFVMRRGQKKLLYDTTCGLWNAGWGTPFTDEQNAAFEHLHAGTYSDEVSKCPEFRQMQAAQQVILADPAKARGIQRQQNEFYAAHAVSERNGL